MPKDTAKKIHDLKLHEVVIIDTNVHVTFSVMRVPGGWIYRFNQKESVFVPLNSEFHEVHFN